MKEMVGGCCVCSDERGWPENPLVYCDGQNCTVAVHQACYGIVSVPTGPWFCRKCESSERPARVRCELCPSRDGALKRTDNQGWAHVVCALYIPEVRFGNVSTMEPIILQLIPQERYSKTCYICADAGKASKSTSGACMQCNKSGCRQQFHVTCAQQLGLLCEEAGNYLDNVKYCGYCQHHYSKLKKGGNVKPIPPYKPISHDTNSSDSPSSPEKDELHSQRRESSSRNPNEPQNAASNSSSSSSSSSKQKKSSSSSSSGSSNKNNNSNSQIPYSSSSSTHPTSNAIIANSSGSGSGNVGNNSSSSTRSSSSSKEKDKDKESKHSSSSSKSVNKISSSTNNKHDKDQSYSSSSYSAGSSSRDKNKSSSSSSKNNSSQNSSNKDDGVSSNSHSSKSSSQFTSSSTSSTTIRITTTSATPTSPVSTIIQKHETNSLNSSSKDNNISQTTGNSSMMSSLSTSQNALNDDKNWHHQSSNNSKQSSSYSSGLNADALNNDNDTNKTNYNAMTKKRKAMHQANSSNRNSADESTSNKEVCKDLSVKVVPIDKLDPSVSEYERHYKKARTDINSQATPAATAVTSSPPEPNIQNVNPNVIHSTGSTISTVNNSSSNTAPTQSPATSPNNNNNNNNNKSQVIQHGMLSTKKEPPESLVVSVPLSSASVPGIQLPTNSISNNLSVSTIVNSNQVSSAPSIHQGTLYQHLTNSQAANQRASPHIQQPMGRASPITPTPSSLANDINSHSANNHTSVLQNMNSSSGSVISSAGFHTNETHKVTFEKQTTRIQAIQQEETSRRSRSQSQDAKKGKKRNIIESSITTTPSSSSSNSRNTHSKSSNARNHSKTNKSNTKNNKMIIDDKFGDGNNTLSINSVGCIPPSTIVHSTSTTNNSSNSHTTSAQSTIVKLTPAQTSSGSARTSSPVVNVSTLKKFTRDEPSTSSRTPDMPPFHTNVPSSGLKFGYEQQTTITTTANLTSPAGLVINTNVPPIKESPPSSPSSEASAKKRRKQATSITSQQSPHGINTENNKEKDSKIVLQNGAIPIQPTHHMLGNALNPTSSMAKTMSETLNMEIEQHSVHTNEVTSQNYVGPQFPGRKDSTKSSASSTTTTVSGPASLTSMLSGTSANGTPQSLEQLLERQWEQGSQFLMEQAQHFDIASLLSCLHQLKIENSRLEDHINSLVSRRDHLLAVNARLAIPLGQQQSQAATINNGPQIEPQSAPPQITNKRIAPPNNPITTIQVSPMENGIDYRGGHNQLQNTTQSSSSSGSNIRHSTTVVKGGNATHVVTIDTPNSNSQHPPQHQFHPNTQQQQQQQFQQQVYQQQSHVNSVRGRQGNSFQSQNVPNVYPPIPKSKN